MPLKRVYPRLVFRTSFLESLFSEKISKSRSKGLGKMSAQNFETIKDLQFNTVIDKCLNGTFEFSLYLELLKIKNASTPPRTVSIATIRDRHVLFCLKEALTSKFPECVNKKRPNRYIYELREFIENSKKLTIK